MILAGERGSKRRVKVAQVVAAHLVEARGDVGVVFRRRVPCWPHVRKVRRFFFFAPVRAFPINYCQTCRNGSKLINLWQEFEGAVSF